ncbi:DUF6083 domain-containing protein [Streptomyces sp. NPDC059913]|uniref:DUF6083 domain-containing protein n=1 Tax=unclassified Streptomyces TaxID=2593676 RepID=UPI003646DD29
MHAPRSSTGHRWDGSPHRPGHRRTLRVATNSPSRLLRIAQRGQCRDCGNHIEWHVTPVHQTVPLHPAELPAAIVPPPHRWHVASGMAHHADDGTPWCRIAHPVLCPAHTTPHALPPALDTIRRHLALRTRRLIDTHAFTPHHRPATEPDTPDPCRPARPVVQLLHGRYLAAKPIENIQCVAQTIRRTRCPHLVLTPRINPGKWTLAPAAPHRTQHQTNRPTARIAVYDLSPLPHSEQLRWYAQHCPTHTAARSAPDLTLTEWEPFDPLVHHAFLVTRLPETSHP